MAALSADLESKIEAYLLGRLTYDEQTRIEALLFEDDDVFEAIRDAEDALIDRYLAGELTPADREAFEQMFSTSTRQERIAFARTLSRGVASGAPVQSPAPPAAAGSGAARSARRSPARRVILPAGAAIAAGLALAIVWQGMTPNDHAVEPARRGNVTPERSGDSPVATFPLDRLDLRRGAGALPRLVLRKGKTTLRLEPELDTRPPAAAYAATLRRVEGAVVWRGTADADVEHHRASLDVPASLVGSGDYVLTLAAPGTESDDSTEYAFRIVTQD